jgi:hypothetical protein
MKINQKTFKMKTNLIIKTGITAVIALALVFTSCRKKELEDEDDTPLISTQANDAQTNDANADDAYADADNSMSNSRTLSGTSTAGTNKIFWPCDATIDTSQIQQGIVTLTFNGNGCNGKIRSGQIKYEVVNYVTGVRWKDVNAQLIVNFINYKVTRNGKNMTINGTHNLVNVTGGLVSELSGDKPSIVRTVSSTNMSVVFDDNTTRQWSVAKRRTWDYNGGNLKLTVTGEGSVNGLSSVCAWGTNRKGNSFTIQITSPTVHLKNCGFNKPNSGTKIHTVGDRKATVTMGTDASGNISTDICPTNFKVEWTGRRGKQRTYIGTYN